MSKQLYYGIGRYEDHWLLQGQSLTFFCGYKEEDGTIDENSEDEDKLEEIFKDVPEDNISIHDCECTHSIIEYPNSTKESMLDFVKSRLEANGYIHYPDWDEQYS